MSTQNIPGTVTQRVILSAAFDPMYADNPYNDANPTMPGPAFSIRTITDAAGASATATTSASTHHWQDTVADGLMGNATGAASADGPSLGRSNRGEETDSTIAGNEFELDIESLTHTFQTVTQPMPMPGVAKVTGADAHSNVQMVALVLDLGMMREIISVQGVLIDRVTHPSSTSGHHIRKQNLLDVARGQWARVHNLNRAIGDVWQNPNRVPALTIGPMHGRATTGVIGTDRDHGYYGDEPSDDPRGLEASMYKTGNDLIGHPHNSFGWDWSFNYRGRRRYRGLIRKLTLTQVAGQPDVWRYTFDFEIIKNELQLRLAQA